MSLINWATCKRLVLDEASTRAHKFDRVSGDVKDYLEARVRHGIISLVRSHPSVGKTISAGRTYNEKSERSNTP